VQRRQLQRSPWLTRARRLHLSTLMIGINVGLLLLALAVIAALAVGLLQGFADEQALERVVHAGQIARQEIARTATDTQTTAQLLAERPTLRRLLVSNDVGALTQFISQFQQTSQFDGIAALDGDRVIAQNGLAVPSALLTQTDQRDFLGRVQDEPWLVMGAAAPVPDAPTWRVVLLRQLDTSYAQRLSENTGITLAIVPAGTTSGNAQENVLREEVETNGQQAARRFNATHRYVAMQPLLTQSNALVGLIETTMPADAVAQSLRELIQSLLLLAFAVATLAALASFVLGRRLSEPLYALTRSADRIGNGDLLTPIPRAASAEVGMLSAALEEMRTQLQQLTTNLRRQEAEAQAIVRGINEGVFSVDRQRRIRFLNPQAAALLGVDVEAAVGQFCGDVLRPQGPGGVRPCAEHCPIIHARFRGNARATEHLVLHNGERRSVVITSAPTTDGLQVQVLRDETEIEATRRLRDSILANISHEFRTPLSAQLASIELLLHQLDELGTDDIGRLVVSLQRGTLRLTQLIDNLLESARIESGQYRIRQDAVAIDEVVEEALLLTQPLLDQRDQHVVTDLPYPMPLVRGDARRLTQVIMNLLANANKYAPAGSTITIGGDADGDLASVWVEDQGPGLPATGGPSLFTRFVRSEADEPEQSGVGLGLWLVQSIVERHGGRVEARSTNQGTRMRVLLPIERVYESTHR
jgi:signal transduction histidine kinase